MKRIFAAALVLMLLISSLYGQNRSNPSLNYDLPEQYVEIILDSKEEINQIAADFSVDKVTYIPQNNHYKVRLWLGKRDYESFESFRIPFSIYKPENSKWNVLMADSYAQFVANWNRYPTYSAYLAIMDTFQHQYPDICDIDTILNATPDNHLILVAHISNTLHENSNKPSFFYTSTMHGDEVSGYYMMIRLIEYILANQNNPKVQNIINNVDLWICPLENPDGTYYSGDNQIGDSPISIRSNAHYYDLNRSYPEISLSSGRSYEPEVQAMMDFASAHSFVMSANMHGGAEVYNYPWDCCTSYESPHPDDNWFWYIGRGFADTCHTFNSNYFTDLNNGVTQGADWYTVYGSRQDYMNYYQHCREVTLEMSADKVLPNSYLVSYWGYVKNSFLNYIEESLYGFRGLVTDSISGEPLEAKVLVNNHDEDQNNTEVYSKLPIGNYHRPIKAGSYSVTFSAEGYIPKTIAVNVTDRNSSIYNVELTRVVSVEEYQKEDFVVFPNPTDDFVKLSSELAGMNLLAKIYNISGKLLFSKRINLNDNEIDFRSYPVGIYVIKILNENNEIRECKVIKK